MSIGGAVTETIYALGLESRVVGVDTTSLYPPEALRRAPNVGYMRALSAEGILLLKPSWVIAIDGSGPPASLKLVSETGVPLTMVHDDPSPDGVVAKIEAIGKLLGADAKAAVLANETRARFACRAYAPTYAKASARAVHPLAAEWSADDWRSRPPADAMIRLAGGANAAEEIEGYKPMTDEGIIAAAPDVILKMNNGNMVDSYYDIFSCRPSPQRLPPPIAHSSLWMGFIFSASACARQTPCANSWRTSIRL